MMGWRIRLIDGDEYDAITAWRHYRHWRPEPIHSRDDITRKWIGRRHYQVSPAVIRVLWDTEREIDLIERQHAAKRNAQTTADADGDDAYIAELLLGDLRYLFLINCLLCNGGSAT